jgi:hypothetical protein
LGKAPDALVSYNRIKHGFVVVVRRHMMPGGGSLPVDAPNDVNVITGVDPSGAPIYEVIPRNERVIVALADLIRAFSDTYKEILYVMLFLWQRGVPIAWDGLGAPPKR